MRKVLLIALAVLGMVSNVLAADDGMTDAEVRAAIAQLKAAADSGDAKAQYEFGSALIETHDAKLIEQGITYLELAAKQGHIYAMHSLAHLIHQGIAPSKTISEAFKWYHRAAEAGFAGAQNNLGDMYETGEGIAKSYGDAIHWYTRAAMQGEPTAYWSLGECYMKGHGVGRDLVRAYQWLLLAVKKFKNAPNNRAAAEKSLNEVQKSMSPEQIAEGLRLADRFVPLRETADTIGDPLRMK